MISFVSKIIDPSPIIEHLLTQDAAHGISDIEVYVLRGYVCINGKKDLNQGKIKKITLLKEQLKKKVADD